MGWFLGCWCSALVPAIGCVVSLCSCLSAVFSPASHLSYTNILPVSGAFLLYLYKCNKTGSWHRRSEVVQSRGEPGKGQEAEAKTFWGRSLSIAFGIWGLRVLKLGLGVLWATGIWWPEGKKGKSSQCVAEFWDKCRAWNPSCLCSLTESKWSAPQFHLGKQELLEVGGAHDKSQSRNCWVRSFRVGFYTFSLCFVGFFGWLLCGLSTGR